METLLITGQLTPERARRFSRLRFDHGDGFEPSVLVGHSAGVIDSYRLSFKALPDRPGDARFVLTDPEDSVSKTWRVYLEDFFNRRLADGEPFEVTDQTTGASLVVIFADNALNLALVGKDVYATEVRVKQWRDVDD